MDRPVSDGSGRQRFPRRGGLTVAAGYLSNSILWLCTCSPISTREK